MELRAIDLDKVTASLEPIVHLAVPQDLGRKDVKERVILKIIEILRKNL